MNIASQADLGQWQFTSAKILQSTERAWNKEGVAWSQMWLPYHLPKGYSGVNGVQEGQNESNQNPGNSPRRWRLAQAYIDITHALNSNIQLSRSLAQQFLFETFRAPKFNPVSHTFLSFFSRCAMLERLNISFFIYEFNFLHRNLTLNQLVNEIIAIVDDLTQFFNGVWKGLMTSSNWLLKSYRWLVTNYKSIKTYTKDWTRKMDDYIEAMFIVDSLILYGIHVKMCTVNVTYP